MRAFGIHHLQVARVNQQASRLADDKDGICAIDRIGEQARATGEAQIPKGYGYDAAPLSLAGDPLHDETERENGLRGKSQRDPGCIAAHVRRARTTG